MKNNVLFLGQNDVLTDPSLTETFSPCRVNPSSHCVGSFTSPLPPRVRGNSLPLPLLLHLTCASKPLCPTPLSPHPKRATPRPEGMRTAGVTQGWAAPPRPRAARPATPSPGRSSQAGMCLRCSGPRARSSPPSNWASNQGRTDPPLPDHPAPGSRTSMT